MTEPMAALPKRMVILLCVFMIFTRGFAQPTVQPDFTIPDTVCINEPVTIVNNSVNASSYYWNFCVANINQSPTATNIGNPGNLLSQPVFLDYAYYNNNYYGFSINHFPGKLVRLDFGNSLLNTPTATDLGNFGGLIPSGYGAEGIQVIQNENEWYAIIVGGYVPSGSTPRILKVEFGADLLNTAPTAFSWDNIGTMSQPLDLHVFKEGNEWYGLTINGENNSVTRFSFTSSFTNTATAVNLGTFGLLDYPTGIYAINDNGFWRVFVTNNGSNSRLVRLDFGSSLLNTPTAVDLGSIGNANGMRDLTIIKYCDEITGFAVNATTNSLYRLDFADLSSVPIVSNLGNNGNLSTPHSISKLFRVDQDLYGFITNVGSNTITRLKFSGCSNASLPSTTVANPPPITYDQPGVYNINLTIDDGLPTQSSICKKVVVKDCRIPQDSIIVNDYTEVVSLDPCKNFINVSDASAFNIGDTVLLMQMKGAIIDNTNTASFGSITDLKNAGNYEFNYVKGKNGNQIELLNVIIRQYDLPDGKVQLIRVPYYQDYVADKVMTCLPWDGSKGGVLAFNVANSLQLNANIDVSARGFRGGRALNNPLFTCNSTDYFFADNSGQRGALKGEGIFNTNTLLSGRGRLANGGGGGDATNSGGAGGGNFGQGGVGGRQFSGCGNANFVNGGIGGINLPYSAASNKVFLGGGGGAGHMNDIPALGAGGNGGGIVIVTCGSLTTNGYAINSRGETPIHLNGSNDDGRSGGGAGGTVLLKSNTVVGLVPGSVRGGNGDNANPPMFDQHGPGGGGGGGVFWLSQPTVSSNFLFDLRGGLNGTNTNINNDPWGAAPGGDGIILNNLSIPIATVLFQQNIDSVRVKNTFSSCSQFDFNGLAYIHAIPITSWQWSFGDGTFSTTQNVSHTYTTDGNYTIKLVITDGNGCRDSITTDVVATVFDHDFVYRQNVCDPYTVQFNGIGSTVNNPYWNFGDGNVLTGTLAPVHSFSTPGNYIVAYSTGTGICTDTLFKTISVGIIREDIILTPDTTICYSSVKQLRTLPSLSFCWTPTTYLDDPSLPNPTTSTTVPIRYYFTAEVTGTSVVSNGDFSQGNVDFTSAYSFANTNSGEGQYGIGTNPASWNPSMNVCVDHSGNGNMLLVNGAPTPDVVVWSQTINVVPNTNYSFSTWIQSLSTNNAAQLFFSINGRKAGVSIAASAPACTWRQFYTNWNSGNNTSVVVSIVNSNVVAPGNVYALDDISFAPVYIKRDSVNITIDRPIVSASADTSICWNGQAQLFASGTPTFSWSPAGLLNNSSIANPIASPTLSTQFIVTGTSANGCSAMDTINVSIYSKPLITRHNDTTICKNTSAQLFVTGGTQYTWSPGSTLDDPTSANPVASPSDSTKYMVVITDMNTCQYLDSIQVNVRPKAIFAINGPGRLCLNDSIRLTASGGTEYQWQPSAGLSDPGIANPLAYPISNTTYSVTITETVCNETTTLTTDVNVLPLPIVVATKSNDIDCSNDRSQLSANGATSFQWTPANSLSNAAIAMPVAMPTVSTKYIVAGTDANGCTNYDSTFVKVDNSNKGGYLMPSAFTPNNDGLNDCYGIKYWGVVEEVEFSIFNRWGERIFFTRNVNQCWDGTYKGVKQDGGVFVYMIKAKTSCENSVFRKGTFVLVR